MTCNAPLLEDVDVFAEEENAEVDTREDKIDWESAFISLCLWIARRIKPKDDGIKQEEEEDVSVKTSNKNQRERRKIHNPGPPTISHDDARERESRRPLSFKKRTARFESKSARTNTRASICSHPFDFLNFAWARRRHELFFRVRARVFFIFVRRYPRLVSSRLSFFGLFQEKK